MSAVPPFIAAAQARCDAAPRGPWVAETPDAIHGDPANFAGLLYVSTADAVADDDPPFIGPIEPADAEFIAAARTDLPAALRALAVPWDEATVEAVAQALCAEHNWDDFTWKANADYWRDLAYAAVAVVRARIEATLTKETP